MFLSFNTLSYHGYVLNELYFFTSVTAQPKDFDMASCPQRNFTCENGLMCVAESERCDGTLHCSDGSDEVRCWRFRGGYRIGHVHYSHSGSSQYALLLSSFSDRQTKTW